MIQVILIWLLWLFSAYTGTALNTASAASSAFDEAKAYGETVFQPDTWVMTTLEQTDTVRIEWRSNSLSGLAYISYLAFPDAFQPEELDTYFDKTWFLTELRNYDSWKERQYCQFDNLRVLDLDLVFRGTAYKARVWLQYVNPHRVTYFILLFPATDVNDLNSYAKRVFPNAWSCEMNP